MKQFSSKCIAFKIDVTGPENILFAGASVHIQPENFKGWVSEGVKKAVESLSDCPLY